MARHRCERCGETFTSQRNLKLHQDLDVCDGSSADSSTDSSSTTGSSSTSSQREHVTSGAEGTVSTFHDDRGFGFVTTADVTRTVSDEADIPDDVFFHISDLAVDEVAEGDRLRFSVIEGEQGLKCEDVEVIQRKEDRDSHDETEPQRSRSSFGSQKDDTKYGPGKSGPTESEIEDFKDDRKFR